MRILYIEPLGEMAPFLTAAKPGVMGNLNSAYKPQFIHFRGGTEVVRLLAEGRADIGNFGAPQFMTAILREKLDVRIISDLHSHFVGGSFGMAWLVRVDSNIDSIYDLKGKRIAINAAGGLADAAVRIVLHKHGLKPDEDVSIVEEAFPAHPAMIRDGRADAGVMQQPQYSREMKKGDLKVLFTIRDAIGPTQFMFRVATADSLKERSQAIRGFLEDYVAGLRWMNANRDEAARALAKYANIPLEDLLDWVFRPDKGLDFYRDPHARPDLDLLQKNIDEIVKYGLHPKSVDVRRYADLSLLPAIGKSQDIR